MNWSTPSAHDGRRPGSDATSTQGRNLKREAEALAHAEMSIGGGQAQRMTDGGGIRKLEDQIQLWQTPSAADVMGGHLSRSGDRKDELLLKGQARMFATPAARDWRSGGGKRADHEQEQPPAERASLPLFPPGPGERDRWAEIPEFLWPAVEPGVRLLVDGMAVVVDESRSDQLRCCGNGVFPLAAALAFSVLTRRAGIWELIA